MRMQGVLVPYNEIVCVFVKIYMTIVIWLVFIPSYFTTFRAVQQRIFVSLALLLNASNILLCLYIAKIYAMFHRDGADQQRRICSNVQVCRR